MTGKNAGNAGIARIAGIDVPRLALQNIEIGRVLGTGRKTIVRVLVTGADGLLGSNLVRELLARQMSVRVFLQPASRSRSLETLPLEKLEGDLLDEGNSLLAALDGCDAVFHCAAITDMWAASELVWKVNYEGTRKVLDACLARRVGRLVFVGSASSYRFGTLADPGDETGPYPEQYRGIAYMESKRQAMELVRHYTAARGLDTTIVCPTFLIGPYDARPSSGELIRQFVNRRMRVTSPGGRNFAHAGDAARAMVSALERGRTGQSYILGGENLSYKAFFARVAKVVGMEPPRFVAPKPVLLLAGAAGSGYERLSGRKALLNWKMARLALLGTYYSPARAIAELAMPQTPIEQAIAQAVVSLKEYGHITPPVCAGNPMP